MWYIWKYNRGFYFEHKLIKVIQGNKGLIQKDLINYEPKDQ